MIDVFNGSEFGSCFNLCPVLSHFCQHFPLHFFPFPIVSSNYLNVILNLHETSTPTDMDTVEPSFQTVHTIDAGCDQLPAERPHVELDVSPAAPAHAAPAASGFNSGADSSVFVLFTTLLY